MTHTFEDMEFNRMQAATRKPEILEGFSGVKIVQWFGQIERQMQNMLKEQEAASNWPYADKIRTYLKTWRSNEITGSINRETLEVLQSPLELMAVDDWSLANYFSNLRDRLRTLIASEEELPRDLDGAGEEPMRGSSGGRGAPPMGNSFGPEEDAPPGEDPGAGAPPPEDDLPTPDELEAEVPLDKKPELPPV